MRTMLKQMFANRYYHAGHLREANNFNRFKSEINQIAMSNQLLFKCTIAGFTTMSGIITMLCYKINSLEQKLDTYQFDSKN